MSRPPEPAGHPRPLAVSADGRQGPTTAAVPPRAGWLFAYDWDRAALDRLAAPAALSAASGTPACALPAAPAGRPMARFDTAGFDLFRFPSNLALIHYDHLRFAARQAARGRRLGWRAVLSQQEHFGALAASLVAEALGLPGARPEALLAAQHKLHARRVLQQVAPEANLEFEPLPARYGEDIPPGLAYPRFVKPVKAAFSVLARRVDDRDALQAHTRFGRRELWIIRHLVEPFDRLCRARLPEAGSAHRMLLEAPVPADRPQHNLDGWVEDGQVRALGVVDAICYPGTQAFMRWETPSRLPQALQQRALDIARRFLAAIGFARGFFNLEFFHDPATDRLTVIEVNPRLASQFGDLYRRTTGWDPHAMSLALALGLPAEAAGRVPPVAGVAASLVFRSFDPAAVPPPPNAQQRQRLRERFADADLVCQPKQGAALARDFKWTGSHHYGFIHLGAADHADLIRRAREASACVGWPAPCLDQPAPAAAG